MSTIEIKEENLDIDITFSNTSSLVSIPVLEVDFTEKDFSVESEEDGLSVIIEEKNLTADITTNGLTVEVTECVALNGEGAGPVEYFHDGTVQVDDIVSFSPDHVSRVETLTSNLGASMAIGVAAVILSDEKVGVIHKGHARCLSGGITRGKRVFLGMDGKPTTQPPVIGFLQCIGEAYSSTGYELAVSPNRVLRG